MHTILVQDNMTSPVISISPETSLIEARKIMTDRKIRRLPIVDNGQLVGIISFTDVLEAKPATTSPLSLWSINHLIADMKVKDIMITNVFSIAPSATIADAARMMLTHSFSGIPVVKNDQLIGMITESDIFRILASEGKYLSVHRQHQWRSGAAA